MASALVNREASRNKMKRYGSGSKEKDSHGNDVPLLAWELITLFVLPLVMLCHMLRVSIDHVVPLAYGQQCVANIQLLCAKCNVTKVRVVFVTCTFDIADIFFTFIER
jgi:5-methylcytosine-specific restriction endonuclease McrA